MLRDEAHGGNSWIRRVAVALSMGAATTGVIRAMGQLWPGLERMFWRPSYAINFIAAQMLGWPREPTFEPSLGMWVQEGCILLLAATAVLWSVRQAGITPFSMLSVGVIATVPWLTNAEAAVVVMMSKPKVYGLALCMFVLTSSLTVTSSWWMARRGLIVPARTALVLGVLVMLVGLYWLNPLTGWMIQVVALSSCVVLTLTFFRGYMPPDDVASLGERR